MQKKVKCAAIFAIAVAILTMSGCTDRNVKLVNDVIEGWHIVKPSEVPDEFYLDKELYTEYEKQDRGQDVNYFIFSGNNKKIDVSVFENCTDDEWKNEQSIIRVLEEIKVPGEKWPERINKWYKITTYEREYIWVLYSEMDNKMYVLEWLG